MTKDMLQKQVLRVSEVGLISCKGCCFSGVRQVVCISENDLLISCKGCCFFGVRQVVCISENDLRSA